MKDTKGSLPKRRRQVKKKEEQVESDGSYPTARDVEYLRHGLLKSVGEGMRRYLNRVAIDYLMKQIPFHDIDDEEEIQRRFIL